MAHTETVRHFRETEAKPLIFRPCIIVFAGLPFTGKTALGRELASMSNFLFLDVDDARLEIFHKTPMLSPDFERERMLLAYQRNHAKASAYVLGNQPVIIGTTYSRDYYHDMLRELPTPLRVFLLGAPDDVIQQRIEDRSPNSSSNITTFEEYLRTKEYFKPPPALTETFDTSLPVSVNTEQILQALAGSRARVITH